MGKSASTPATPTLGKTLNEVAGAMPQLYSTSAQFNPMFSSLNMQGLQDILYGTAGGTSTYNTPVQQAGWYDANGNLVSSNTNAFTTNTATNGNIRGYHGAPVGHGNGNEAATQNIPDGVRWLNAGQQLTGTRTTSGSPGLLSLYGRNLNDLAALNRSADPAGYGLLDTLNQQASSDLALGNRLSDAQTRLVQQSSRQGAAARGLGYGPSDVFNESLMMTGYGDDLLNQRRQFAANMLGVNQGIANNNANQASGFLGTTASGVQGNNPMSGLLGLAHDNQMTGYNAQLGTSIANAQGGNAIIGGLLGTGGMIGGALIM